MCHARAVARRLDIAALAALDLLELFAFVRPAQFCVPTPRGLAAALGLRAAGSRWPRPASLLVTAARALLQELAGRSRARYAAPWPRRPTRRGWGWGPAVLAALPPAEPGARAGPPACAPGRSLPEWQERAPPPPPGNRRSSPEEARRRLAELLGADAEARPQQADYAAAVAAAFAPRERPEQAACGAGRGRHRRRQDAGLYRAGQPVGREEPGRGLDLDLHPQPAAARSPASSTGSIPIRRDKRRRVVVRKGRENYLCLLNYEEAARGAAGRGAAIGRRRSALIARWIARDRATATWSAAISRAGSPN